MLWEEISQAVNAVGTAKQTVTEAKDKWKNLHSIAKKEFAEFKRENKITGGGWPPKSPSIASKEIIEVLEDMHNRSKPNKPLQLHSMQIL